MSVLAFLFPQDTPSGVTPLERLTTIDAIELQTGIDFLAELPDIAEDAVESRKATSMGNWVTANVEAMEVSDNNTAQTLINGND